MKMNSEALDNLVKAKVRKAEPPDQAEFALPVGPFAGGKTAVQSCLMSATVQPRLAASEAHAKVKVKGPG